MRILTSGSRFYRLSEEKCSALEIGYAPTSERTVHVSNLRYSTPQCKILYKTDRPAQWINRFM